ncbi:MAG: GntR family transcriptional regulator [Bacillota bacterium]|nr:GntR family transcriptional regulator [Bacillota bacterium]
MTEFHNKSPIYLQLMAEIKKKILAGIFAPGEKLPTVRDLAMVEGVNPNTAQKALTQLEAEGLIYANRTSGRFVTDDKELIGNLRRGFARSSVEDFLDKMEEIGYEGQEIPNLVITIQKERTKQ